MKPIRKVVIPAAGFGTRFLPATKAQPKEMLPIVDKPAIQYIVEEALASNIEEIIIITGRNKRAIEDHFDGNMELEFLLEKHNKLRELEEVQYLADIKIHYIRQRTPKGLGDAILCAKDFIGDEPFAVMLGDDIIVNDGLPCMAQLMKCYEKFGGSVLGIQPVPDKDVCNYGIVDVNSLIDRVYQVNSLVEKPSVENAPSNLAVLGRYILSPEIFRILESTAPGKNDEIQLTDAISQLHSPLFAYNFEGKRYDTGDKLGYLKATVEFALRNEHLKDAFKTYLEELDKNGFDLTK